MASRNRALYTGVTSDLQSRVYQHKKKLVAGFTKRYNITRLVWYEETNDIQEALALEKRIKGWLRNRKIALIESVNPDWDDLAADWFD